MAQADQKRAWGQVVVKIVFLWVYLTWALFAGNENSMFSLLTKDMISLIHRSERSWHKQTESAESGWFQLLK